MRPEQKAGQQPRQRHDATTGWLCFLPEPWELCRGPTPVTLRCWSDGVVEADFADALLVGRGDDASALDDLREQLALVLGHTTTTKATLAGAALRQHRAVLAVARRKPEVPRGLATSPPR